jgi:protein-disulfide isomerase
VRISGARVALLLLPVLLAGCAGESLFSASGLSSDDLPTSGSANGSAANASAPEGATKTAQSGFNPFDTPMGPPPSKRVVIKKPTQAQIMKTGPLPEMAFGRADAPITIVQYASLTCPYCRRFHKETFPKLKKEFIDTGKVRYVLREFPSARPPARPPSRCVAPGPRRTWSSTASSWRSSPPGSAKRCASIPYSRWPRRWG